MSNNERNMACEEFGALLLESAERGTPTESERWALERHAHECPDCWMELTALDQLGEATSETPSGAVRLPSGRVLDELTRRRVINALAADDTPVPRQFSWRLVTAVAGGVAVLGLLVTFLAVFVLGGSNELTSSRVLLASKEIRTPSGGLTAGSQVPLEQMHVRGEAVLQLEEGIHLLCKTNTRLKIAKETSSTILVELQAGTAFARVEPERADSRLRFSTSAGRVEVTGTILSVSVGKKVRVRVWRGHVRVEAPEKPALTVKATQQAVVGREQVTAMSARQLNLAWKYISKIDLLAVEEGASVSVRTRPSGAVVYLDDLPLGRTPISMTVGPGQRELRVARSGYSPVTEQLDVAVGSRIDRSYRLMRRAERAREPAEPEEVASAEQIPPRIDLGEDSDAEDMSRRALSLRIHKKYDQSYQTYTKLIKHFPDTPAGRAALISRGLLLLEAFDRPQLALADFTAYLTRHKGGNHVPEATFGQALVYRRLGKISTERRILNSIIKLYPDSEQAMKAKERLRKMGKKRGSKRNRLPDNRR